MVMHVGTKGFGGISIYKQEVNYRGLLVSTYFIHEEKDWARLKT